MIYLLRIRKVGGIYLVKDFFDLSKKELKKLEKEYELVDRLADTYRKMSDDELKNKTSEFKQRLANGETLDQIKYEVFAQVREADLRVLGLYPFKVQVIGSLALNGGNIAEMSTGEGKANPVDTPVPTPDGWKTVGDIKVGDYLFDRLGKPTQVTARYPQGLQDTYMVTFKDGRQVPCNLEHLWSVYDGYRGKKLKTYTTKQLLSKGVTSSRGFNFHVPINEQVEYSEKQLSLDPYIMGMFLGNGCKNSKGTFELSTKDFEVVEYVADYLNADIKKGHERNYTYNFNNKEKVGNRTYSIKIKDISPEYVELLSQTYSYNKYIPNEYKISSINQRWELIKGLMDSDGTIYDSPDGQRFGMSYSTTSKQLRDDIAEIVYSLGLSCTKGYDKKFKDGESNHTQYVVRMNVPNDMKPNFFKLKRKKDIAEKASISHVKKRNYSKQAIVSIDKLDSKTEQVCFTVDNSEHLFLIGDYVVTHNTLTATMVSVLNALEGKGVHIVTVNEYLSERDGKQIGEVYEWLGLTVGINKHDYSPSQKQQEYAKDITFTTHSELGFDYLRDNMVTHLSEKVQRPLNFCVIDEVDSILIDEARTPLIISNNTNNTNKIYNKTDLLIKQLKDNDVKVDVETKTCDLTESGIDKIEKLTGIKNIYAPENVNFMHHIYMSLRANFILEKDTDYVVRDNQVMIVDLFTGRIMDGRRYSDGLHQSLEAKEGVPVNSENVTMANITYQNLFRLYKKLSGMTGTAVTEEEEFREIYNMIVVSIPTNKPVIREDRVDLIFPTMDLKFKAVLNDIKYLYSTGQPVLVGTSSVEYSEYVSQLLTKDNIPHNVLNAKNHHKEADIILNAGQKGAITIATNMAGRGTDIKLGQGVKELGGLFVMGTERYESRRIDNQLRGRSGRQGDVGASQFYVSLEDMLPKRFGSEKLKDTLIKLLATSNISNEQNSSALQSKFISNQMESAQKRVEGNNYDTRKQVLQYDDVVREQRETIYKQRDIILSKPDNQEQKLFETVKEFSESYPNEFNELLSVYSEKEITENAYELFETIVLEKLNRVTDSDARKELIKNILISVLDEYWVQHIDELATIKDYINLRSYAQVDPFIAYQEESFDLYNNMILASRTELIKSCLRM